jgi:hypothetical protein
LNASFSAREGIARTGFSANDVTKLQENQISCQGTVRGMSFGDSEHDDCTNEKLNASFSAREGIARTGFSANDVTKLQENQISCQGTVRGMSLGDSEHDDCTNENSKTGLRQGKQFNAPDFRRMALQSCKETKYNVKERCEE